jgi:hypothetical protein
MCKLSKTLDNPQSYPRDECKDAGITSGQSTKINAEDNPVKLPAKSHGHDSVHSHVHHRHKDETHKSHRKHHHHTHGKEDRDTSKAKAREEAKMQRRENDEAKPKTRGKAIHMISETQESRETDKEILMHHTSEGVSPTTYNPVGHGPGLRPGAFREGRFCGHLYSST